VYPKPMTLEVKEPTTLRELIAGLGEETLYVYDRRVVGVVVNGKRLWDSAKLKTGDRVTIYPIIVGG
jgi:sulfur carrier protein ThiS